MRAPALGLAVRATPSNARMRLASIAHTAPRIDKTTFELQLAGVRGGRSLAMWRALFATRRSAQAPILLVAPSPPKYRCRTRILTTQQLGIGRS